MVIVMNRGSVWQR